MKTKSYLVSGSHDPRERDEILLTLDNRDDAIASAKDAASDFDCTIYVIDISPSGGGAATPVNPS